MDNNTYKLKIKERKLNFLESNYLHFLCESLKNVNSITAETVSKFAEFENKINRVRNQLNLNNVNAYSIIKTNAIPARDCHALINKYVQPKYSTLIYNRKKVVREKQYYNLLTKMLNNVSNITDEQIEKCKLYELKLNEVRETLSLPKFNAFDVICDFERKLSNKNSLEK